jgi:hypothetical protein
VTPGEVVKGGPNRPLGYLGKEAVEEASLIVSIAWAFSPARHSNTSLSGSML